MQKAARMCDSDFTKKKPEKLETQRRKGRHSRATDHLLARGQSCAIKLGFATDYGGSILTRFIGRKD